MSLAIGIPLLECVYVAGCVRWGFKKCIYIGEFDSASWSLATYEEFEPVPRICRVILAVYEEDLTKPLWAPPGGYGLKLDDIVKKTDYEYTEGNAPPYLIYVDHQERDIILAIRGLNLGQERDYRALLDNRLGQRIFDGGYVHHGLLKSATWLLNKEAATLIGLIEKYPNYTLTFAGHSLGSGVAALMVLVVAKNREALGKISRNRLRGYCVAPARSMSLNLAVQYADVIRSVILQDDFLPRTSTPLQDVFGAAFCLPCMLIFRCCVDTCTSEKKKLKDPRRLYAPGRMYHIVERQFCSCGKLPPEVRTNVPVEGRFDQIVLSCNATSDHSIVEIEKEAQIAMELLHESVVQVPPSQKMERQRTLAKELRNDRRAALERAVTLNVPFAFSPEENDDDESDANSIVNDRQGNTTDTDQAESSLREENGSLGQSHNWNDLVEKLFSKTLSQTARDDEGNSGDGESSGRDAKSGKPNAWNYFVERIFSKSKVVRSSEKEQTELQETSQQHQKPPSDEETVEPDNE
ncbi:unnamed protein product [Calypogeia fissa]